MQHGKIIIQESQSIYSMQKVTLFLLTNDERFITC